MGTELPQKGHSPQFLAHVYYGQKAGWIKMLLGTVVGLGPGDIVLMRPTPQKEAKGHARNFRPMSIVAKRSPISATIDLLYALPGSGTPKSQIPLRYLVADRSEAGRRPAASWNLAYHLSLTAS